MLAFPPFRLSLEDERLWKGNKLLTLRRKPFAILRYFAGHPNRLITQDELMEHVWGGSVVSDSAVRTHLHELRQVLGEGVIETVIGRGYRFIATLADDLVASQVAAEPTEAATIVGRDAELATLRAALEQVVNGHRRLCFVTGDPGIGKTTLIDAFVDELDAHPDVVAVRGHCIEQQSTPEAYLAVIEVLGHLRQSAHGERVLAALVRHAPTFLAQLPHLVPDAQLEDVSRRARSGTEVRMVRELIEALEAVCMLHPLVLVLEDLHWSDVATIDLLALLGERRERAKMLVIATSRHAEAQTVAHPLNRVMRGLVARSRAIAIPLGRVAVADISRLIDARFPGHRFPAALVDVVARITAGTPLFIVSLLEDLVGRAMIAERDGSWSLVASLEDIAAHRPASVTQLIDIQLDRLAFEEQRVLEAASVIGLEIPSASIAAALEMSVERADEICDGLARRGLFLRREGSEEWPDSTLQTCYAMSHGLVQTVCVERASLARRQRWHRLIAERLEAAYGNQTAEISHVLATHYDKAQSARATHYYILAARRTAQRFARRDALRLFDRGLELLPRLPDGLERDALELQILAGRGPLAIRTGDGMSSVPLAQFERAVTLARRLDDAPRLFAALIDLDIRCAMLANYRRASEISDQLDALSATLALDIGMTAAKLGAQALESMYRGQLVRVATLVDELLRDHVSTATQYVSTGGRDMSAEIAYFSLVTWLLGESDHALLVTRAAADRIRVLGDPFMRGLSLVGLGRLHFARRDAPDEIFATARQMPETGASAWHVHEIDVLCAWANSHHAPLVHAVADELVAGFRRRVAMFPLGATIVALPLIGALRRSDLASQATAVVEEVLTFARERGERIFEPELVRLRGQLREPTDPIGAADAYLEALSLAHAMKASSLELRIAIDLATLWRATDRRATGDAHLAAAIGAFAVTLETPELVAARQLAAS